MYVRNANSLTLILHTIAIITNVIAIKPSNLKSYSNNVVIGLCYLNYQKLTKISCNGTTNPINLHTEDQNFYKDLHKQALEVKEFQLHLPPTTDAKLEHVDKFVAHKNGNLQASETDILKLVDQGIIPDFRYPKTSPNEANILSWHYDRPPDIYILKFEGVINLYPKESAIVAFNSAQSLLNKSDDFTIEIPLHFYHLLLHSLPYLSTKQQLVLAALKYLKYLHKTINHDYLKESMDHLIRANKSSDPFQPLNIYTNINTNNKRISPFMMNVTNDVFGLEEFVKKNINFFKNLNIKDLDLDCSPTELLEAYKYQQRHLESLDCWEDTFLYRNLVPVSDVSADRFHQLAFNHAAAQAILHHITVWKMPVYLASNFYTVQELDKRINSILKYVAQTEDVNKCKKYISLHSTAEACEEDIENNWLSKIVACVTQNNDVKVLPVHVFSDRLTDLNSINPATIGCGEARNLHLYFTDWGHSVYSEKLQALYSNEISYCNHTKKLVSLMALPCSCRGRGWDAGYQLLTPIAEVEWFLESWKNKWCKQDKTKESDAPPQVIN